MGSNQIKFIENHKYFTSFSTRKRKKLKNNNLQLIKNRYK